jgi:hypothetical protein
MKTLSFTVSSRISRTNYRGMAAGCYSFNDLDINQHVDNPEGTERREDARGEFRFKLRPLRVLGADGDGLKFTQERGGTDGKTPCNLVGVQNCLSTHIIQQMSNSK